MKKILLSLLLGLLLFSIAPQTFAANTLLPTAGDDDKYCDPTDDSWYASKGWAEIFANEDLAKAAIQDNTDNEAAEKFLACALKTGHIQFWMVPYFVTFMLEFLISIAGLIAILMLIVGAYYYIAGGLTDDKEKGKTIIKYALGGLILTTLSWVIVNIILLALTS